MIIQISKYRNSVFVYTFYSVLYCIFDVENIQKISCKNVRWIWQDEQHFSDRIKLAQIKVHMRDVYGQYVG